MPRTPQVQAKDNRTQSQRFMDIARELGCDEDEGAFKDKLRMIARRKPEAPTKSKKPAKRTGR
jgi:hypothetical protein